MIAVADVVTYVSTILNDQEVGYEFTVWEEQFLEQAAREAVALISGVNASAFVKTQTMLLNAGASHPVPVDLRNDFKVVAQVCGTTKRYNFESVNSDSIKDSMPSAAIPCDDCKPRPMFGCAQSTSPCGDWELRRWAWSTEQADVLYVYPPVVTSGTIEVSYTGEVVEDGSAPLHEKWFPAIVSFVLFRAYSKDNESQIHAARAATNYDTFVSLTGIGAPKAKPTQGAAQ